MVKLNILCIDAPLICLPPYSSGISSKGKYSVSESGEPCKWSCKKSEKKNSIKQRELCEIRKFFIDIEILFISGTMILDTCLKWFKV